MPLDTLINTDILRCMTAAENQYRDSAALEVHNCLSAFKGLKLMPCELQGNVKAVQLIALLDCRRAREEGIRRLQTAGGAIPPTLDKDAARIPLQVVLGPRFPVAAPVFLITLRPADHARLMLNPACACVRDGMVVAGEFLRTWGSAAGGSYGQCRAMARAKGYADGHTLRATLEEVQTLLSEAVMEGRGPLVARDLATDVQAWAQIEDQSSGAADLREAQELEARCSQQAKALEEIFGRYEPILTRLDAGQESLVSLFTEQAQAGSAAGVKVEGTSLMLLECQATIKAADDVFGVLKDEVKRADLGLMSESLDGGAAPQADTVQGLQADSLQRLQSFLGKMAEDEMEARDKILAAARALAKRQARIVQG